MSPDSDDKNTPLITGRSPSMRRAQKEHADPSPAPDPEMIAALSAIAEREHAAAAAYRAAAEAHGEQAFADGADRHAGRARSVAALVAELGAAAPDAGEADPRSVPVSADEIRYLGSAGEARGALERDDQAVEQAYDAALGGALPDPVAERLRSIRG